MDIRIKNARISFAQQLRTPSAAVEGGVKKYGCDFIVTPDSIVERKVADKQWVKTTLEEAQLLVAAEAHKGDAKKAKAWFGALEPSKKSVRNGDLNVDGSGDIRDGYEGCTYVAAKSNVRMPVYRADNTEVGPNDDTPVYSGCYVDGMFSLYVNLNPAKKGVFAGLSGVRFRGDGPAFGGGARAAADDFGDPIEGGDAADFG